MERARTDPLIALVGPEGWPRCIGHSEDSCSLKAFHSLHSFATIECGLVRVSVSAISFVNNLKFPCASETRSGCRTDRSNARHAVRRKIEYLLDFTGMSPPSAPQMHVNTHALMQVHLLKYFIW